MRTVTYALTLVGALKLLLIAYARAPCSIP